MIPELIVMCKRCGAKYEMYSEHKCEEAHPRTIDTNLDALRELCEAAPETDDVHSAALWVFYFAARNALPSILDELDRLRAAEAASKARVNPDADRYGLRVSDENLNANCPVDGRVRVTLDAYALDLRDARAEIARLTDAGAGKRPLEEWHVEASDVLKDVREQTCAEIREALAPPPPAAADRGVPDARALAVLFHDAYEQAAKGEGWETQPSCRVAFDDLPEANQKTMIATCEKVRAALATAPKAEDVRREAEDLVAQLERIHKDAGYQAVWTLAFTHGQKYRGPNYEKELAALKTALARLTQ